MSEPSARPFSTPAMATIEAQIAATRAELAATVDELTTQLDPRTHVARLAAEGRKLVADARDPEADPADRKKAFLALGVAAGAAALVVTALARKLAR